MKTAQNFLTIDLEVAGPAAMFARPDTGATPISYPVPTYSAAKGMFETVLRRTNIYIDPMHVEVCKPVRYERYMTNYGGPLRKPGQISKNNNYQLIATILVDAHYRLYAKVKEKQRAGQRKSNYLQDFKDEFDRRLQEGQTFYTPCLGWKEFAPSYFGPLQPETRPDQTVNLNISSLLHSMWEHQEIRPTFRQNWEIVKGIMSYEQRRPPDVE
jgi:CRISPR-associated protein Cas5d